MPVERKCPKCATWNGDNDFCTVCGEVLSPQIIEERREAVLEEIRNSVPPDKFDLFVEAWKNHRFFLFRAVYYLFYSVAMIFMAIASFFAYITIGSNG